MKYQQCNWNKTKAKIFIKCVQNKRKVSVVNWAWKQIQINNSFEKVFAWSLFSSSLYFFFLNCFRFFFLSFFRSFCLNSFLISFFRLFVSKLRLTRTFSTRFAFQVFPSKQIVCRKKKNYWLTTCSLTSFFLSLKENIID